MTRANRSATLYKKSNESDSHFEKSEAHFRSFALKKHAFAQKSKERSPNPDKMWPFLSAWHHPTAIQAAWPYKDMFGSIFNEDALPPPLPFPFLGMLFIYEQNRHLPRSTRKTQRYTKSASLSRRNKRNTKQKLVWVLKIPALINKWSISWQPINGSVV